jgi:hypothetical protein
VSVTIYSSESEEGTLLRTANLVASHCDWPGLVSWFGSVDGPITCQRFRDRDFRRAAKAAKQLGEAAPKRADFTDRAELSFVPADGVDRSSVRADIRRRERDLADLRTGPVLGVTAVLEAEPFDAPVRPKRSPMPSATPPLVSGGATIGQYIH